MYGNKIKTRRNKRNCRKSTIYDYNWWKNSSNTKKLYEIAKKYCENCISIETEEELPVENIKQYETIGIMAGASTPGETIKNVEKILEELDENKVASLI